MLELPPSSDPEVVVSDDGEVIFTTYQDRIVLWNAAVFTPLLELELPSSDAVTVRLRGRTLAPDNQLLIANRGNSMLTWDLSSGRRIDDPTTKHTGEITDIAVSPQELVATTGRDGATYLWNGRSGRRIGKLLQASIT